jgi:hypothetical protein
MKSVYSKHGRKLGSKKHRKGKSSSSLKQGKHLNTLENMISHIFKMVSVHGIEIDIKPFLAICTNVYNNEGKRGLLIKMKAWKLYLQQYMLNQNLTYPPYSKVGHSGHPKVLEVFISIIDSKGVDGCRLVLSIFRTIELIKLKPKYDYDTITSPKTGDSAKYKVFLSEFKEWLKTWKGLKLLPPLGQPVYPIGSARGPNTSKELPYGKQLLAIPDKSAIAGTSIEEGCKFFLDKFFDISILETIPGKFEHSKVVSLSDNAGKERIIAMGDIISNWALSSLEIAFQSALRRMSSSVVNQNHKVHKLIKLMGKNMYSVDLSAMTDRLPRELNYLVVEARYGKVVAENWINVLANRTFSSKIGEIRYEVGNPMGLLSSWSSSTFVHHALVEFILFKCKTNTRKLKNFKYLVLGDDLLMNSKSVYNTYVKILTQVVGIQISLQKCTISCEGSCEFIKRLFRKGVEVTGFPVELYKKAISDFSDFVSLLHILEERGYNLRDPVFMSNLEKSLRKKVLINFAFAKLLPVNIFKLPYSVWCSPVVFTTDQEALKRALMDLVVTKFKSLSEYKCKLVEITYKEHVLIPEYHPLLINIGEEVFKMLQDSAVCENEPDSGEFSIWNTWENNVINNFKVEYFEVPSVYPSSQNVIKRQRRRKQVDPILLKLIKQHKDSNEVPLTERISNVDLFELAFK